DRLIAQTALLVLAVPLDLAGNVGHWGVLDTFGWRTGRRVTSRWAMGESSCGANGAASVGPPVREATIAGRGPISPTRTGRGGPRSVRVPGAARYDRLTVPPPVTA